MRNLHRMVVLFSIAPFLGGGCSETAREVWNDAVQLAQRVDNGLNKAKSAMKKQCAAVQTVADEAAALAFLQGPGRACRAKNVTEGFAASVRTACAPGGSIDRATVLSIGRIGRGLIDAYQRAEAAKNAGC